MIYDNKKSTLTTMMALFIRVAQSLNLCNNKPEDTFIRSSIAFSMLQYGYKLDCFNIIGERVLCIILTFQVKVIQYNKLFYIYIGSYDNRKSCDNKLYNDNKFLNYQ